jgi:hypothetical protein
VIEQNERGAGGGENSQPERRAKQAPIILKISSPQNKKGEKQRAKIRSRMTFDFCPLPFEFLFFYPA